MTIDNAEPAAGSLLARPEPPDLVADLYRAHAVTLIRIALLLVGDQQSAEDVVQDAFVGLQRGLPRLREPGKALPYLRACVLNGCRTVQRTRHRARLRPAQPAQPAPVWSAEAALIADEDRRAVLAAVAELPQRAREVLAVYLAVTIALTDAVHQAVTRTVTRTDAVHLAVTLTIARTDAVHQAVTRTDANAIPRDVALTEAVAQLAWARTILNPAFQATPGVVAAW